MLFLLFLAISQAIQRHALDDTQTAIPMSDEVNTGTYAGVTVAIVLGFFIILILVYCFLCRKREERQESAGLLNGESEQAATK